MRILKRLSRPVDLTGGVPWRVILQYAAPIMQQIYVLTDTVICGQVLLAEQVAGVNDTFPLTFFFLQFAFGCTAGFSVLTAKYVGAKEDAGVRRSLVTQGYLTVGISLLLTLLSLVSLPWLLHLLSLGPENPVVYDAAYQYCFVIFLGIFAQMGYNLVCGVLRALGDSVSPLLFLLVSTALNVGLDLFFLIPLSMGPLGAALATVIGQIVAAILALWMNLKYNPDVRIRPSHIRFHWDTVKEIYRVGIPSIVMMSISSVMNFGLNQILIAFSTTATAVFGVYFKLQSFIFMPVFGLNNGMVPIISYNYGARKPERVKKTIRLSITAAICLMLIGLALFELIPGTLLTLFNATDHMRQIGIPAFRIIAIHFLFAGFCIVSGSVFQAIGNPLHALINSVCRQLVVLLPAAWLLAQTGKLEMVWFCFPIAEIFSFTLSAIFLRKTLQTAHARMLADDAD